MNKNKTMSSQKLPKVPCGFKSSSSSTTATPAASPLPTAATASAQAPAPIITVSSPLATPSVPEHTSSSQPAPNCRIREVHCGNQVRLVVIAIRNITKGEEITVDYSLIEWGETLGFRGSWSPTQTECNFEAEDDSRVKKEDEPLPLTVPHQEQVTPSWPLSPSASPISHSDASGSEREEEDPQGRTPQRRKKRRGSSKKRTSHRTSPGRAQQTTVSFDQSSPSSESLPQQLLSSPSSSSAKAASKSPLQTAASVRGTSAECTTQTCEFCGRQFRSLGRHLDKHHAHQPDVCSALVESYTQMPRLQAQSAPSDGTHTHFKLQAKSSGEANARGQSPNPPILSEAHHSPPVCPSAFTPPPTQSAVGSPVQSNPTATTPLRKGGKKRSKTGLLDEEGAESGQKRAKEETTYAQSPSSKMEADDNDEENDAREAEYDSGTDDKGTPLSSPGRPHMLPLLSALSSLVLYLRRLQHSAFLSLSRQLQSAEAWRLLCHSSLSLLILYNRRRECEVSKLSISEYRARITPLCPVPVPPGAPPALTPLEASLSPFERLVLTHLPRVGVQGKRGRIQPLILPPNSEPCLELLLQTRDGVGVEPANPYMFARPYHSPATPLRGTELLRSLARSSGIRNPRILTQAKVRRQVGILTQLLFLGEGEEPAQPGASTVERLEHFLEREYHVTQNCADIGQDPGLMGRVGRVVLCGERDGVLFRGMSLNHICLELDVMSENSGNSYSEGESDGEVLKAKSEPSVSADSQTSALALLKTKYNGHNKKTKSKQPPLPPGSSHLLPSTSRRGTGKRGVLKRPWSEAERAAVEEHLNQNITELRVPAKADCERCLQNSPLLVNNHRDWRAVKFYCHNRIQLLKKIQRRETQSQPLSVC